LDGAELGAAEARRAALLASLGVGSLAEARDRQAAAQRLAGEADLAERRLDTFAPRGIDDLRAEIARSDAEARTSAEAEGDPAEARISHQRAADRLAPLRFTATRTRAERDAAAAALIEAERALHTLEAELSAAETALGPADARADRETALAAAAARAEAEARTAKAQVDQLRAGAPDIEAAEASLRRLRSARDVAASEGNALAEKLASLDGRISALSQQSVEEELAETSEKRLAADLQVARWKAEADALSRLVDALQKARTEARDQYLSPVMRELKPLLGLVLPGAEIAFDGESLLPQTITRNGQEEDVEVLSGGMREQLSILTRLAFARLLASRGAPTPVILDDALVYSDDDRIERMFDVLHRQSRDQQIIVFSCRQRAFAKLGGTTLQFSDWAGPE
jgi:DNA repair exonuclease SbcCD ATPase subunit